MNKPEPWELSHVRRYQLVYFAIGLGGMALFGLIKLLFAWLSWGNGSGAHVLWIVWMVTGAAAVSIAFHKGAELQRQHNQTDQ
jgi:hypothetical protein